MRQLVPPVGYRLRGRLQYSGAGDEITYRAEFARRGAFWTVDFRSDDAARNLSFGADGPKAWASSPEATVLASPEELPACARFDYPQLIRSLADILGRGSSDKQYLVSLTRNEFLVRGTLPGEITATFLFEGTALFPRKITLHDGTPPVALWSFVSSFRGRPQLLQFPGSPKGHVELWFSDPETIGSVVYPRRTDFADARGVSATFFLDEWQQLAGAAQLVVAPPEPDWESSWNPRPTAASPPTALFLPPDSRAALIDRLNTAPWSGWSRTNALLAWWCVAAPWIAWVLPGAPAPRILAVALTAAGLFALILLYRRRRSYGTPMRRTAIAVTMVLVLLFAAGIASYQMGAPHTRSRMALQCATRYALTGTKLYARASAQYLRMLHPETVAGGNPDLSCAAYAATYDLCRTAIPPDSQDEIETKLLEIAKPLYGNLQGWRARSIDAPGVAAGLGLVGLVTGCEPCVSTARATLERSLADLFRDGVHRAGPGPGATALSRAADLAFALKNSRRHDYFADPRFAAPVRHTLSMLSPAGTLPLIGATNLEHSFDAHMLALKVAGRLSGQTFSVDAAVALRSRGSVRRAATGRDGWWRRWSNAAELVFDEPLVLFEASDGKPPADSLLKSGGDFPDGKSLVIGDRIAVLRSGSGPEDLCLSIGVLAPDPERPVHDALGFDLIGRGAMLLHGSGYPGAGSSDQQAAGESTGKNTVIIGDRNQGTATSAGITCFLINQPLFDFVQADADRTYENARVRRDIVMVRPEKGNPGYLALIDDVEPVQQDVSVTWQLFSHGDLSLGFAQNHQWVVRPFRPRRDVMLSAFLPGNSGQARSEPGRLYSADSGGTLRTTGLVIGCAGRQRIVAILAPRIAGDPEPRVEPIGGGGAAHIQRADWISLGSADVRQTTGPLQHVSEFVIARERRGGFPGVLMCNGTEFRMGAHSLTSTHPVTLSTDGLRATVLTTMPGTTIEIRSPAIPVPVILTLDKPGQHPFTIGG